MAGLTKEFLTSIGVDLGDSNLQAFLDHSDDTLYERILESALDTLDEEHLLQFADLRDQSTDALWLWLQKNVPELHQIIKDEVDILLGDIAEHADHL